MIHTKDHKTLNNSGSGASKRRLLCHSQSRRNQPHQGHCVQQPQKQRRSRPEYARLAFFTLCTLLRRGAQQVPRQALRSSGANPAFARSHSPSTLSLRKRGALSYCGTINLAKTISSTETHGSGGYYFIREASAGKSVE